MKALVLAGGYPQISLIMKLKKMGYYVILADWNKHPVAEKFADKFYQESTLDIPVIERIAINENVDLIITVCTDQALNTVATVSEKLRLPCYIDAETGRNVTNKRYMKNVFLSNKIPTAAFRIYKENDEIKNDMNYPVIVKPVDCNSSKGVVKVFNDDEFVSAIQTARKLSRTHDTIAEEFVKGTEFTIDAIVIDGKSTVLCISEIQKINDNDKFIICRTLLPSPKMISDLSLQIEKISQMIADAFKLKNCPLLIQVINDNGNIKVVEFSARTGGGEKYKSIEWYTGVDIIQETINLTLGKHSDLKIKKSSKYMLNEFIYCNKGTVKQYVGFEEAKEHGAIENLELYRKSGSEINDALSSGDRAAGLTFVAESYDELFSEYNHVMKKLKIIDSNGNDLMRHDIIMEESI